MDPLQPSPSEEALLLKIQSSIINESKTGVGKQSSKKELSKHEDENRHQSDQPSFKKPANFDNQPKGEVFKAPVAPPPGFQPPGGKKVVKPPPGFNSESSKVVKPPPGFNSESSKVVRPPPGFSAESNASGDNKPGSDEEKSRRVFLSNLDFSVTEEEVKFQSSG